MSDPKKPRRKSGSTEDQILLWESDAALMKRAEQTDAAERGHREDVEESDAIRGEVTPAGADALRTATVPLPDVTPSSESSTRPGMHTGAGADEQATAASALPDQEARNRIRTDLDTNLLVEAGAGAGKTTEMVSRMVALVESGRARIENLAAVTFTRKAAGELRERFQIELERRAEQSRADGSRAPERERLERAVAEIDRGFIGTIHSFCARVLREHPIEAGLDPGFAELQAVEEARLRRHAWHRHLERLVQDNAPVLARLAEVGLRPAQLYSVYETLVDNPDVYFPAPPVQRPAPARIRRRLEQLHDRGLELMPRQEPEGGWDMLQKKLRGDLRYWRHIVRWEDDVAFFNALSTIIGTKIRITKRAWPAHVQKDADELCREFDDFTAEGSEAHEALMSWLAHRYPIALELARSAAESYEQERRRNGWLSFEDLLVLTAGLLEQSDTARRSLSARFTHLLVDEFQDTDPIQARVLMLIAADDTSEKDWRRSLPRPGALFVVGDPKQSIYRFRRADILTYNQVKERFRTFGHVVELTANFRSRKPIEAFVNTVFRQRFPPEATMYQAAFAPIEVQREDAPYQGVFSYRNGTAGMGKHIIGAALREDAARVASWIRLRIDRGERTAGSFLILTRHKRFIDTYARALEARSIPVQASGAAVGIEDELAELELLMKCLADPADASLVLAVLTGLFFGIDLESLTGHVVDDQKKLTFHENLSGPSPGPGPGPTNCVQNALDKLHEWWLLTKQFPSDVAIPKILDEIGLLVYAAAGELGETRAGSLLFALDAIRVAALRGDSSLTGAIDALDAAYAEEDAEAPLQPGRSDVVRVMNLHKAKGLEADVVILGDPRGGKEWEEDRHISRPPTGEPLGYLVIRDDGTQKGTRYERTMAQPLDWPQLEAEEDRFKAAENDRLLYVAATRAREELVISRWDYKSSPSPWLAFYPTLLTYPQFAELPMPELAAPEREHVTQTAAEIASAIGAVDRARSDAAAPTFRIAAVTKRLRHDERPRLFESTGQGRGRRWGSAVHAALQAAGRGVGGTELQAVSRALLLTPEAPVDENGEPEGVGELVSLVEAMRTSEIWQRAEASGNAMREVPFGVRFSAADWAATFARLGLDSGRDDPAQTDAVDARIDGRGAATSDASEIVEGVIDLAFREADGWVLADFKSDTEGDTQKRSVRETLYRRQLDLYAACWTRITGEEVKERRIVFTADRREVAW